MGVGVGVGKNGTVSPDTTLAAANQTALHNRSSPVISITEPFLKAM